MTYDVCMTCYMLFKKNKRQQHTEVVLVFHPHFFGAGNISLGKIFFNKSQCKQALTVYTTNANVPLSCSFSRISLSLYKYTHYAIQQDKEIAASIQLGRTKTNQRGYSRDHNCLKQGNSNGDPAIIQIQCTTLNHKTYLSQNLTTITTTRTTFGLGLTGQF